MASQRYVARYKTGAYQGLYAKTGGGVTDDLQKALVLGWRRPFRHRYFEDTSYIELIPVVIAPQVEP